MISINVFCFFFFSLFFFFSFGLYTIYSACRFTVFRAVDSEFLLFFLYCLIHYSS